MNYYQITYDHTQYYHPDALHSVMTSIPGVSEWWHFLPSVYIVESNSINEQDISNYVGGILSGLRFFVVKIDINSTNGVLPKSAWDWINKKSSTNNLIKLLSQTNTTPTTQRSYSGNKLLEDILRSKKR